MKLCHPGLVYTYSRDSLEAKAAATDACDFREVGLTPGGSGRLHPAEEINIAQKQANTALKEHFNGRKPSISLKKRHSGLERAV
jgi:hypothetical protein